MKQFYRVLQVAGLGVVIVGLALLVVQCKAKDGSSLTDEQSDSAESMGDVLDAMDDVLGNDTNAMMAEPVDQSVRASILDCPVRSKVGTLKIRTFGSGDLEGDYALASWDLAGDKPKAMTVLTKDDLTSPPTASDTCERGWKGYWKFAGKTTWDTATQKIVRHVMRSVSSKGAVFFVHAELDLPETDAEDGTRSLEKTLKLVRGRWVGGTQMMAQVIWGLSGSVKTDTDSEGQFRELAATSCIHHLLLEKYSYHEVANIKRYVGAEKFCCHPMGGTATVYFYDNTTSCSEGKPSGAALSILQITYPTTCGGDGTYKVYPGDTTDFTATNPTATITGKMLCALL